MKRALAVAVAALTASGAGHCLAENMERDAATGACMLFIKKVLHDPDSATFEHSSEAQVLLKGNRALVIRSVRANNAFGAKRLTEFICLLEVNNGGITAAFIAPHGQDTARAQAIVKKWGLLDPPKKAKPVK